MTSSLTKPIVPFFNYPAVFSSQEDLFIETFREVGRRGAFILQKDLEGFEKSLAAYSGVRFALGVANGTDAIYIALRAAGIGAGDEVIFCSHTFIATAAAIHLIGATPVAIDCGADHMMDPSKIEAALTHKTRAIVPTQLNGRTADMDAIMDIANRNGLIVVEDAAQALGSKFNGRCAGTFGIAGTISFYPAKTLGAFGDAGAILTNDEAIYQKCRQLRDHGRNEAGEIVDWGYNSRLDNIQAAFLNVKLTTYDQEVATRRSIASRYQQMLGTISQLRLPPAPDSDSRHFDVFQNYEIEAERRDELQAYLKENGVGTIVQWGGKPVHQWKRLAVRGDAPYTDALFTRCLLLPMHAHLTNDDVHYVCETIRHFYDKR